jgi:UDP-glucose 4-epimerase
VSNILVVGGNGFIGSHLVDALSSSGQHCVTVLDLYPRIFDPIPKNVAFIQGNLHNTCLVRHILEDRTIDIVYHCAWTTIHETANEDPAKDIMANVVPTLHMLEACRKAHIKRVIFLSSGGTVYGSPQNLPAREDYPTNPINAYGVTKLLVEKYLHMYFHLYGLEYLVFRPSVPYGPRQNPHRRQGAVSVFIYHALRGEPITIWGAGDIVRDYFYVEDMNSALLAALRLPSGRNGTFNLAGLNEYSLNELIHIIEQTLSVKVKVSYESARKFDVPRLHLDISAASRELGWSPTTSLSEGIQRTAVWIQRSLK